MNISNATHCPGAGLVAGAVASILLYGCATAPLQPEGAQEARARLTRLQADPNLSSRAPAAIAEAAAAVQLAEQPQPDPAVGEYRVYIAERKVDIASAQARTRFLEDQRVALKEQRQDARLDARTREADAAHAEADMQRQYAIQARSDADSANLASSTLAAQAVELQGRIDSLNMQVTDRGLVLTLGDVLFPTGESQMRRDNTSHLDGLANFLNQYPDRTVLIEGHTDNVGGEAFNQDLSQRRADSVREYLMDRGISSQRLTASGMGQRDPVASNDSATGRQQNRRVEVIVSNPAIASR